jgi:GTP-binding protein
VEPKGGSAFADDINRQIGIAINEADLVVYLVDAKDGMMPADQDIAAMLRPIKDRVVLAMNKSDNEKLQMASHEFARLGLGEPINISAYHGRGIDALLDAVMERLPQSRTLAVEKPPEGLKIAIVGRPNVGKSSILNKLLGEERVIVSPIPGTTRDAIDTSFEFEGQSVILIDTAGIKRRGRVGEGVDKYSVIRSMEAIDRADIALLVLDAGELVTAQDLHVAGYIQQAFKGVIVIVNKWDMSQIDQSAVIRCLRDNLKFMRYAPILFTSATDGTGISEIMPEALKIYGQRLKRIPTAELNSAVEQVLATHTPPHKGAHIMKFLYTTQAEVNPPTFVFFVNDAALMHFSYQRFLENQLRRNYGFEGTPIRLIFKTRGEKK